MAYAVQQDIIDRYGEAQLLIVADRDGDGLADVTAVTRALNDASAEIDTYLAARYPLPLTTVPDILKLLCVDIAIYRLGFGPGAGGSDEQVERYKAAVKLLESIAKGVASLESSQAPAVGGAVIVSGPPRLFSRHKMQGLG